MERRHLLTFAIDLFADVNQLGVGSQIDSAVELGGETFFVADDGKSGSELWKTDGTAEGTVLVKDLLPGPDTSSPRDLTVVGGELFFTALDENSETDLWKSDGTETGTVKVFDADASGVYYLSDLTESGGKLFFTAYELATGYELWVSDGTAGGTQLVLDINPDQFIIDRPQELTDVNGTLFFTSYDNGYYNRELWKSDGTAEGTMMVADLAIDPGFDPVDPSDDDPSVSSSPRYLTNVGGMLYFVAEDWDAGVELFKSDGTESGTMMVSDLNPNGSSYPSDLTAFDGDVFFAATDGASGRHLYRSGGAGAQLVADTTSGLGSSNPGSLAVVGNELFFAAQGSLPATTVTAAVPNLTADNTLQQNGYAGIVAETTSASAGLLSTFANSTTFNSVSQCCSDDGPGWVSSGSRIGSAGVVMESIEVGDLYIQSVGSGELTTNQWEWTISDPAGLTDISFAGFATGNQFDENGEGLVFELFLNNSPTRTSVLEVFGDELDNWYTGRGAANVALSDPGGETITTATVRMSLGRDGAERLPDGGSEAVIVNASLTANLTAQTMQVVDAGRELHKTDGTSVGTVMVKDIVSMGSSNPFQLREVGGKLFFAADDVLGDGQELWVSDGTEGGTVQLVDSLPGQDLYGAPLDGAPELIGQVAGQLLFTTRDATLDRELWSSDGTSGGTALLRNINPATADANPNEFVRDGQFLYFAADDGIHGEAVWRADTSTGMVEMIADVSPTSTDNVAGLTLLNGQIVFYNNSLGTAGGVYITDGAGGFDQLSDLRPVELDASGKRFEVAAGQVFFAADDGINGVELFKTDGVATAVPVADFVPGGGSSNPSDLTEFQGALYFVADSTDYGRELFSTTGSAISLVADVNVVANGASTESSSPDQLTVSGNRLFFTANDGAIGRELYWTTGSGASLVVDLRGGGSGSDPLALTDVGGTLYFSADDGTNGREPFKTDGSSANTLLVQNVHPTGGSNPSGFLAAGGLVYFSADDGSAGQELWKTDGTPAGTAPVADIAPGPISSDPVPLFDTGKRLIFSAAGTSNGDRELWATDGSELGTMQIEDLYPTEYFGSDPAEMTEIGGDLYFAATNEVGGRELFRMREVAAAVTDLVVGGSPGLPPLAEIQRSSLDLITLTFNGVVDVPASAIELVNRDTGVTVTSVIQTIRVESGQTILELTFGSGPSVIDRDPLGSTGLGNSLANGNYQLTIEGAAVIAPISGASMAGNYVYGQQEVDRFFRQFGDTDGDRDVDGQDYGRFGQSFLTSSGDPSYLDALDFDGDGDVDGQDYGHFSREFFKRLEFR
ncbi:ELWxxDGT repeat protein [Roseiconus nitratireducens]|uniref:ELWxxDGT repeat protein n=1 Tax=Roseiconus nitratireducens TaxID=2605748 RepID=UPI0013762ED5|nr:ELWxxDGT repeat protein [Roseiconus nitratireducens]